MSKRTPLYDRHAALGGKIVEFGGWDLPVQYSGILQEHENTRARAGLFDVSHMGEFTLAGPGSLAFLNRLVVSDLSAVADGQVKYSLLCDENGGTVDDLLVYRRGPDDWYLVVNAANTDKDREWILSHRRGEDAAFADVSEATGEVALQGPEALAIADACAAPGALAGIGRYRFRDGVELCGVRCLVSRTGYTGEDGYEIYCAAGDVGKVWDGLLAAGASRGLLPAGLGARDTLRFEASMTLYGHELSSDISPVAAGLKSAIAFGKPDFIGREALLREAEAGPARVRVGFEMVDKGIARNGYEVKAGGEAIGFVTSGSYAPTLKKNLGMAMTDACFSSAGDEFDVEVRGAPLRARVVPMPFYKRSR